MYARIVSQPSLETIRYPRQYAIQTTKFLGDANGEVSAINTVRVEWVKDNGRAIPRNIPGSEQVFPAQLVLLAMGFGSLSACLTRGYIGDSRGVGAGWENHGSGDWV